jgi:hypothetical protein
MVATFQLLGRIALKSRSKGRSGTRSVSCRRDAVGRNGWLWTVLTAFQIVRAGHKGPVEIFCGKCGGVFGSAQEFVAHVRDHRRRRRHRSGTRTPTNRPSDRRLNTSGITITTFE